MREFDLNPEPEPEEFSSVLKWTEACTEIDEKCTKKVAEQYGLDEETVTAIWNKVEGL